MGHVASGSLSKRARAVPAHALPCQAACPQCPRLMTSATCDGATAGAIVELPLSTEAWAVANPIRRTCDRAADAGAYCSPCAGEIMASALNLHCRGRRKKLPPGQGILPR